MTRPKEASASQLTSYEAYQLPPDPPPPPPPPPPPKLLPPEELPEKLFCPPPKAGVSGRFDHDRDADSDTYGMVSGLRFRNFDMRLANLLTSPNLKNAFSPTLSCSAVHFAPRHGGPSSGMGPGFSMSVPKSSSTSFVRGDIQFSDQDGLHRPTTLEW